MSFFTKAGHGFLLVASLSFSLAQSEAVTREQLRNIPHLTPERFAAFFADFEFKFHTEIQDYDVFLASKSGDCDDYATLAASVLSAHGYTTQLIAVRMKGETHVVCYINEKKSYLDYNLRSERQKLVPCEKSITAIARKVASSFARDWIATYQFSYDGKEGVKRLVQNIVSNRVVEKSGEEIPASFAGGQRAASTILPPKPESHLAAVP